MSHTRNSQPVPQSSSSIASAGLRIAFGLIWAVDAALTWTSDFATHYVGYLHNAAQGQADWSAWWFDMWINIVTPNTELFVVLTRLAETALALALLFGFARKFTYILGALFSILIWSTAEGFGGPYVVGGSNMGAAIAYVLIFMALLAINHRAGPSTYSVDYLIERRFPFWRKFAEWNRPVNPDPNKTPWGMVSTVLIGLAVLAFFLVAGLTSTLNVEAPTPKAAAAAVSPLTLASSEPVANPRDAALPPVLEGDKVNIEVVATDKTVSIASGVQYKAWTFGDKVPGPVFHVKEGQEVTVTFINRGTMHHSVDFHSAITPPSMHYVSINPGEKLTFTFTANTPGVFLYHCGTPPVLLHMANGMFGAIVVDPVENPLPPADKSYVLVQSEWYTKQIGDHLMGPDYDKMMQLRPDEVVFNGIAFQYSDHPLTAKPGERVRFYFVNAGPSLWSAFHIIGGMFEAVYPDANANHALHGVSTYSIGPGEGVVLDATFTKPGEYHFVDHSMAHMAKGAAGVLKIIGEGEPDAPPVTKAEPATGKAAPAPAEEPAGPYEFDPAKGEQAYAANCAVCHQANGEGMPGVFPPLKGNKAVLNDDPSHHIDVVLHGLHGKVIDGVSYSVAMPPFGALLNDTQIANIINHERTSWGNDSKLVTADQVAAARKK